jgi:hypothetical protein
MLLTKVIFPSRLSCFGSLPLSVGMEVAVKRIELSNTSVDIFDEFQLETALLRFVTSCYTYLE